MDNKEYLTTNYNMNQICTNKQQSSRLLKAGVRPETADFYLLMITETDDWSRENVEERIIQSWMDKPTLLDMDGHYPAWSLSYLIGMMPKSYQDDIDGMVYYLSGNFVEFMYASDNIEDEEGDKTYTCANSFNKENVMDNVVDAIEWLIREGHFDKKYLTDKCGDCKLIEDEDANGEAWCAFHQKPVRCDSKACKDILEKGGSND